MAWHQTSILGNLGQDPTTRYMPNGDCVCNFSVAVTETWKDKSSGDKKENTTWYRVNAFRQLGEICGKHLNKGSQVLIVGKMQTRTWSDKEGVERTSWELTADTLQMLGKKEGGDTPPKAAAGEKRTGMAGASQQTTSNSNPGDFEDDIPF